MNKKISCTASDIYYRILQLGSERVESGISFEELKEQLKNECFITSFDNTEHIEQWFDWSFEHKEVGCKCPRNYNGNPCGCEDDDECDKFDHENLCGRFLRKDALIDFSRLEQSHKYNEKIELYKDQSTLLKTQLKNNKFTSRLSLVIALVALLSSLGILGLNAYNTKKQTNISSELSTNLKNLKEIDQKFSDEIIKIYREDTILLNHLLEKERLIGENSKLIEKKLKSINYNVYQLKKYFKQKENE